MKYSENIEAIAELQPDYLGFIFWENSKRRFDSEEIPQLDSKIKKVGVFVDAKINEIIARKNQFDLDLIQLHGSESVAICEELQEQNIKIIKAFSINNQFDFSKLKQYIPYVDYFLFDTKGKLPGGNGITFDWKILENYSYEIPYFLSGGIGSTELEAVKQFIKTKAGKNCVAIDVNSRFELKSGYKNENKLRKFKKSLYEN
ncbi:phosphoribosylanthranilate isomerase [Flavobacterium ardleyense]|uniref:N-(5'-phosphoribosyl)anthranilate isomerase n=1 Tax=Flavobacterium ardleyense TaxID=2038737 RepID=A0ABW5Z8Q6_9FLAO